MIPPLRARGKSATPVADVKCDVCERRIYAPEGGRCTGCSDKSGAKKDVMGTREYLVTRTISSVSSIKGKERLSAILEYACTLLESHGMAPPFALKNGRIDSVELYQTLECLREHILVKGPVEDHTGMKKTPQKHEHMERVKTGHLEELGDSIEFLLVEKSFTIDDSQISRKMVFLVRALNCHTPRDIRRLARSRSPPELKGPMVESSSKIKKLLSLPPKKSPEWICPGPRVPSPYRKAGDDTHARRVFWKSRGKQMPPPAPPETLYKIRGILAKWPVLAKYDFMKAYEE